MQTIVWYSVFTFLSALVTGVWQLAVLRLLAGIGIGGEWAMGGTFVAEEWPEPRRLAGAGLMHTGYYVGTFFASLANYVIGSHFGWRTMRSEEHTSELQSHHDLVCRLLLEKKK